MNRKSQFFSLFLFLMLCIQSTGLIASTQISNPRALSLAGSYIALAKGIESPHWNPANLGLHESNLFSMNLFSFGIGINNNSFSKSQYDMYNGSTLTKEDLETILNSIPDDGLDVDLLANTELLGFAYGNYAFTISGVGAVRATVAKDIPALLPGNELDRVYNLSDCNATGWSYIAYGFSGAYPIQVERVEKFAIGASLKFLQGLYGGKIDNFAGTIKTDESYLYSQADGAYSYAKGGNGFAIDFGVASKINRKWSVGLSFSNLINSLSWKKDAERTDFILAPDSLNLYEITQVNDKDSVFNIDDTTNSIGSFSMGLPRQLRLGAAYFGGRYIITVGYIQGFSDGPGATKTPQLASGIEFSPLRWLPLRLGLGVGGQEKLLSAVGLGLKFGTFQFDIAATNQGSLLPANRQGSTLAFGIRFIP